MPFNRRDFIKAGAIAGLSGCLPAANTLFGANVVNRPETYFTRSSLMPQLKTIFRVRRNEGGTVRMRLIAVIDRGSGTASPTHESFSAFFAASKKKVLSEGTYRVDHPTLNSFDLHIKPAGNSRRGFYYEVMVNRL